MDPDQALRNALDALKAYRAAWDADEAEAAADKLADAFEALDGWLSKGGFLPQDWADASKTCGGA